MKSLIVTLIVSALSLNVMANENPRPELESARLEQDVQSELQQAIPCRGAGCAPQPQTAGAGYPGGGGESGSGDSPRELR